MIPASRMATINSVVATFGDAYDFILSRSALGRPQFTVLLSGGTGIDLR